MNILHNLRRKSVHTLRPFSTSLIQNTDIIIEDTNLIT
jgi:ribosome biogenesis GTP-binding protein YsxC/EngB